MTLMTRRQLLQAALVAPLASLVVAREVAISPTWMPRQGLMFHRDAFKLAMVDLDLTQLTVTEQWGYGWMRTPVPKRKTHGNRRRRH